MNLSRRSDITLQSTPIRSSSHSTAAAGLHYDKWDAFDPSNEDNLTSSSVEIERARDAVATPVNINISKDLFSTQKKTVGDVNMEEMSQQKLDFEPAHHEMFDSGNFEMNIDDQGLAPQDSTTVGPRASLGSVDIGLLDADEAPSAAQTQRATRKRRVRQATVNTELSSKVLKAHIADASALVREPKRPRRLDRSTLFNVTPDPWSDLLKDGYESIMPSSETRQILSLRILNNVIPKHINKKKEVESKNTSYHTAANEDNMLPMDNDIPLQDENVFNPIEGDSYDASNNFHQTRESSVMPDVDEGQEENEIENTEYAAKYSGETSKENNNFSHEKLDQKTSKLLEVFRKALQSKSSINFNDFSRGFSRHQASTCFFEMLQLKNWDYINVEQDEPYGNVTITAGANF